MSIRTPASGRCRSPPGVRNLGYRSYSGAPVLDDSASEVGAVPLGLAAQAAGQLLSGLRRTRAISLWAASAVRVAAMSLGTTTVTVTGPDAPKLTA
jgi:hypothetical protein